MNTKQPKKMIIINILNILKKYSDKDHPMTQQDIANKLREDYMMEVDRKTVKKNLLNLLDIGLDIDYTEIPREDKSGGKEKDTSMCTDWYIQPEFDDSELRLIIDSLLFSKTIPRSQCRELIDKLIGLSNIYFSAKVKHVSNLPENKLENKELFYTIDVLDDAINQKKKVAFVYNNYGTDKALHPKHGGREYIINPYQMVATNGRYYLICNNDDYDTVSNYRVDRITNIRILSDARKPVSKLSDELNLPKHMAEHIYMFAGESIRAKFKAKNYIADQVLDWYGKDVKFTPLTDDECVVEVTVNENALFYWAMQYGEHIVVLEPSSVRERIANTAKLIAEKYT